MDEYDEIVLGGGWAGLLYADMKLYEHNRKIAVIEKESENNKGGLLRTEIIDGLIFDTGGTHLLFSRDANIISKIIELLGDNVSKRERNNYVLYGDSFIPYPFENGIYKLDPYLRVDFVKGIIERMIFIAKNSEWKPSNFKDWITGFFGDVMAREYLIPYNIKIWKRPLENMAADWIFTPGRLPFPQLEDMIKAAAGLPNIGYKEQAYFYYPNRGGIQSLFNSLYERVATKGVDFLFGKNVKSIETNRRGGYIINNEITANSVVSTIPLPELLLSLGDSKENRNLANEFDYNSVIVVGVAISSSTPDQTTIYVPDPKVIFHRYTWMSSLANSKDSTKSNLIAEITIPKGEMVDIDKITSTVIRDLANIGAIKDEKEVIFTRTWFNKYGYPIYTLNHNKIREKTTEILNYYGIKSVGRWGSWHYWNTDMVYKAIM
ncbi:MAG: FAD-dependent oxidoreductase, partial [Nanoarchaeota archaeon]|nr:FAD-dependent oxidoreductase [Nanoarchaeota archaeon]